MRSFQKTIALVLVFGLVLEPAVAGDPRPVARTSTSHYGSDHGPRPRWSRRPDRPSWSGR